MLKAFLEAPRFWNPIPGSNHPQRDADGKFIEVVRIYPIPAISSTFHLQVSSLRQIEKVDVVNHCPMLYVREKICGAISIAQFQVILSYEGVDLLGDFIAGFSAYDYEFALLGQKDTNFAQTKSSTVPGLSMAGT